MTPEPNDDNTVDREEIESALTLALERQNAILEEQKECRNRLENLSTAIAALPKEQVESPVLNQLMEQVTEIRTEQARLSAELARQNQLLLDMKPTTRQPEPIQHHQLPEQEPEKLTAEHVPAEPHVRKRVRTL